MDLFDDERVKVVIELEPQFAEQKKKALLRKLDADEKDVEECMAFIQGSAPDVELRGKLRERLIVVRIIPGGYYLTMDGVEIDDCVPNKKEIIDFIYGIRNAVYDSAKSIKNLESAVEAVKSKRIEEEEEKSKREQNRERIQTFFSRR